MTGDYVSRDNITAVSWPSKKHEPQALSSYQIGDVVEYVPHVCHAFNCNQNNEYPWVIGMKQNPRWEEDPCTGERKLVEEVKEIDEGRLHRHVLPAVFAAPDVEEARKNLVPLRPVKPWTATVRAVNPDGTLNLDVSSNVGSGMVTLHYDRVPIDETGQAPHSCRRLPGLYKPSGREGAA